MVTTVQPVKDQQTVTPTGESVRKQIEGVILNRRPLHEDERGELVEVYNPAWGIHPDPLAYVYMATVRPGAVKGWVMHAKQDDRVFVIKGTLRWVLFDNREASPTFKMVNAFTVSERNRGLLTIPKGVYHAAENIGQEDAYFINLPTRAYDHADPDKFRLPVKNDLIPFDFDASPRW